MSNINGELCMLIQQTICICVITSKMDVLIYICVFFVYIYKCVFFNSILLPYASGGLPMATCSLLITQFTYFYTSSTDFLVLVLFISRSSFRCFCSKWVWSRLINVFSYSLCLTFAFMIFCRSGMDVEVIRRDLTASHLLPNLIGVDTRTGTSILSS